MYKLFIFLLIGFYLSIGQISNRSSNGMNAIESDSLVDIFPLAVGNQWTYNYYWEYHGYWANNYWDTGTVFMQIINIDSKRDSTIWSIQEIFNIWHRDTSGFTGPTQSIDTIQIVELDKGQHQIYKLDNMTNYYGSVFQFPRVADKVVNRYDVVDSVGIRIFVSNNISSLECYYFNFKQDVGLTSIFIEDNGTSLPFYNGSHTLRSQNLTNVSNHQRDLLGRNYYLSQNYPNPFNPSTVISYQLPVNSKVSLKIYDLLGREVATLVNEEQSAGWKEVEWNASNIASGIYFYKLQADNFIETKKMLVIK